MPGLWGTILSNLSLAASQSIRRNAADDAWEAYTPSLPYIRNEIIVVVAGALTTGLKPGFIVAPAALTIEKIECQVDTQPTGANGITVDIHLLTTALKDDNPTPAGTTLYTTQGNRPVIAAASNYVNATLPDVTAIAAGEVLRVILDTVGGTIAGSDLTVCFTVRQTAAWS